MTALSAKQLLGWVLRAIDESGWQALVIDAEKPFKARLFQSDGKGFDVRVYIWNCTHGGGQKRAPDEYRVQLTGTVPDIAADETTLLLGWHSGLEVFVGFDINKYVGQSSHSPSIQVKQETLLGAHTQSFAVQKRQNDELAVAFWPEFFAEYALNVTVLHATGKTASDVSLFNQLDTLTEDQIEAVRNNNRRTVLAQIFRKYRAADFRRRVLGAYSNRCAFCGVQLELIDAAHIIPVVAQTSTDETTNGVALCKLHHAAFDRNLVSFDERYRIEISDSEVSRLKEANLIGGLKEFKRCIRTAIIMPNDRRDYPSPKYIAEARRVRRWS